MATDETNPPVGAWEALLLAVGLQRVVLLSERCNPDEFGDGEAVFGLDGLGLRLIRERGQDFLQIAATPASGEWFRFDDVSVAMGWRTTAEVVARQAPSPLREDLELCMNRHDQLAAAFEARQLVATHTALDRAIKTREDAFMDKLARLADKS